MFSRISCLTAWLLCAAGALAQEAPPAPPTAPAPLAAPAAPLPKPRLSPLAPQPDWNSLAACNDVLTREEFETVVSNIYMNDSGESVPWKIGSQEVLVETTPGQHSFTITFRDPATPAKSFPRYWRNPQELPPLKPGEPVLTGLHIALDPGHIGGAFAKMEERWLSMEGAPPIMEGSLTLQVAQLLKPRLEALGASVSLVRSQEAPLTTMKPDDLKPAARQILTDAGVPGAKESYAALSDDERVATVQYQAEKLFYRVSEIRTRAQRVNAELKPDLVICLHLNAEEWNNPSHPTPSPKDHFHLLVNGSYGEDELLDEDERYDMLQRVFARISDEELRLADVMATAMAHATDLPPFVYTKKNARRVSTNPYVYARNLLANRLYQCPVIYLEPFVMNNDEVYHRLLLGDYLGRTLLENHLVTSPLEDYVTGVVTGLTSYYQSARHLAQ